MNQSFPCGRVDRRAALSKMGLTAVAMSSMLARDGLGNGLVDGWTAPTGQPMFAPKAKSVIWFFMLGGTSHMESFDPKPALTTYAGKTIDDSPYKSDVLDSPFYRKKVRDFAGTPRALMAKIYPLQIGFKKRGESGIEVSDWWPHVGGCVDDLAIVRSMWTTDNDHAAQLQFHTGRHVFDGFYPSIGSWIHYGLGTLNENLPQFVVMGGGPGDCCGGSGAHEGSYLGPAHSGVPLRVDPSNPLSFATPGNLVTVAERWAQLDLLRDLHAQANNDYSLDPALKARIESYALAFRMQMAVPEIVQLNRETAATQEAYGLNDPACQNMGRMALTSRRLVEQGVRFVQIYDDGWDAHSKLLSNHETRSKAVDQPIAALLKDLKQRGMLDETLVVWATEFGRTPGTEGADGRDHHNYGFSVWLAGGGIKGGMTHGKTDELGFHAVEHRHYVTDIHATVLHQLGLDPRKLSLPSQKRLEIDYGEPIREIMA